MDETRQPGIQIVQILLERAQFSHRDDALELPLGTQFQPNLAINFQGGVAPDEKAGFVRIRVRTKAVEKPLYNFDVTMIAVLTVDAKDPNLLLKDYVRTAAPVMLYPFVREAVASLTGRGRFGPVWLAPFNVVAAVAEGRIREAAGMKPKARTRPKGQVKRTRVNVRD